MGRSSLQIADEVCESPPMSRRLAVFLMLTLVPVAGVAAPVIGGDLTPAGKWPDTVATLDPNSEQECTGTLIAPTVVLTADHCIDSSSPVGVVVGAPSLLRRSDGEVLTVSRRIGYPNGDSSYDVGILVLSSPSRVTPRP